MQKTNQKEVRIEKVIKKKSDEIYVKWKGYNNLFNTLLPKSLRANVKVKLDLSNYATKADLKNATRVDTSDFTKKD